MCLHVRRACAFREKLCVCVCVCVSWRCALCSAADDDDDNGEPDGEEERWGSPEQTCKQTHTPTPPERANAEMIIDDVIDMLLIASAPCDVLSGLSS